MLSINNSMNMKNLLLSVFFAFLIVACATKQAKENKEQSCCKSETKTSSCCEGKSKDTLSTAIKAKPLIVSVDQILSSPGQYIDKKLNLKGFVVHTCKKTGKKMFLKGENDSVFIRVDAGEEIAQFDTSIEGDSVIATGYLKVIALTDGHIGGESCSSEEKSQDYMLTCEKFKSL